MTWFNFDFIVFIYPIDVQKDTKFIVIGALEVTFCMGICRDGHLGDHFGFSHDFFYQLGGHWV